MLASVSLVISPSFSISHSDLVFHLVWKRESRLLNEETFSTVLTLIVSASKGFSRPSYALFLLLLIRPRIAPFSLSDTLSIAFSFIERFLWRVHYEKSGSSFAVTLSYLLLSDAFSAGIRNTFFIVSFPVDVYECKYCIYSSNCVRIVDTFEISTFMPILLPDIEHHSKRCHESLDTHIWQEEREYLSSSHNVIHLPFPLTRPWSSPPPAFTFNL